MAAGGAKNHPDKKNGASREQWEKRKSAANDARTPQEAFFELGPETSPGLHVGKWIRKR